MALANTGSMYVQTSNGGSVHLRKDPIAPANNVLTEVPYGAVVAILGYESDRNWAHVAYTLSLIHISTAQEMRRMEEMSLRVNDILSECMREINIELIDFKLEFGRYHGEKMCIIDSVYVVNTCTVTGTGDKKSLQAIRCLLYTSEGRSRITASLPGKRQGRFT